jgi:hypothetical protein
MSSRDFYVYLTHQWPKLLLAVGWCVFWLVVVSGERLPIPALFIGPGMMAVGLVVLGRKRSRTRSSP